MKYIFIIKSFDTQAWIESHGIIAFKTESEARKYCQLHSKPDNVIYSWDVVYLGAMQTPYPKKKKDIVIAP